MVKLNEKIENCKDRIQYFKFVSDIFKFLCIISPLLLILSFHMNIFICIGIFLSVAYLTRVMWVFSYNKNKIYSYIYKKLINEKNQKLQNQFR